MGAFFWEGKLVKFNLIFLSGSHYVLVLKVFVLKIKYRDYDLLKIIKKKTGLTWDIALIRLLKLIHNEFQEPTIKIN